MFLGSVLAARQGGADDRPAEIFNSISGVTEFTVTDAHLKLLRRAYVTWTGYEYGAPAIDCKRPCGNSNVYDDIAEVPLSEWGEEGDPPPELEMRLARLHAETAIALQIVLATGEFTVGPYTREETWSTDWKRAES